jgi:hypothetical protein
MGVPIITRGQDEGEMNFSGIQQRGSQFDFFRWRKVLRRRRR